MSRTAAATPPPPLFHQKNSTPTARHGSKGGSAAQPHASGFQRFKKPSKPSTTLPANQSPLKQQVAPMSASDMLGLSSDKRDATPDPLSTSRTGSIIWSEDSDNRSTTPSMSGRSMSSEASAPSLSIVTPETTPSSSVYGERPDIASPTTNPSFAQLPASAQSPRSWGPFGKVARAVGMISPFSRRRDGESPKILPSPAQPSPAQAPTVPASGSGMSPYIAPSPSMAPSSTLVSPAAFSYVPSPEVTEMMETTPLPPHAVPPAVAHPHNMPPALTPDSPPIENPVEALRRYEWAEEQRRIVTEFARLCSQWPQSSYNQSKWGPNGCNVSYVPQSWANPRGVMRTMQRQAEMERKLCEDECTHFVATGPSRSTSLDDSSVPSLISSTTDTTAGTSVSDRMTPTPDALCAAVWAASKVSSPEPMSLAGNLKIDEQKRVEEIRAAMASPMLDAWRGESSIASLSSTASVATTCDDKDESKATSPWASIAGSVKSLSELDQMANLATTDRMDVDEEVLSAIPSIPGCHPIPETDLPTPVRTQSCPAKRPLTFLFEDEEKRRKVDEPMMLDNDSTVTTVTTASASILSHSTPNMAQPSVLFGHVVKTSHTHPIVISPFIPNEIMPTLAKYLVTPTAPAAGFEESTPLLLDSDLDVPTLLLSCAAPSQPITEAGPVGNPVAPQTRAIVFNPHRPRSGSRHGSPLGNLMLSSCPGKRLRMDGPVKGRGPVCRDLATDLRRIKSQGVGAIVW